MKIRITIELTDEQYNAMKWYLSEVMDTDNITRQDVVNELTEHSNFETYRANNPAIETYIEE